MMIMMITIKYKQQPTGNSCGPTCIYMALHYVLNKKNDLPFDFEIKYTISDISEMCGTDWIVGTPPDRMEKGMSSLNINYVEYISPKRPYELIKQIILEENVPILRTITQGVPHWIIIRGFDSEFFYVSDPWLGEITYTIEQLDSIWKIRNYQFFEILPNDN